MGSPASPTAKRKPARATADAPERRLVCAGATEGEEEAAAVAPSDVLRLHGVPDQVARKVGCVQSQITSPTACRLSPRIIVISGYDTSPDMKADFWRSRPQPKTNLGRAAHFTLRMAL